MPRKKCNRLVSMGAHVYLNAPGFYVDARLHVPYPNSLYMMTHKGNSRSEDSSV